MSKDLNSVYFSEDHQEELFLKATKFFNLS